MDGEGDGIRAGEVERLLALGKRTASMLSFGEEATDRDLVLSMLPSALLWPARFSTCFSSSSSSSLVLFKDEKQDGGISSTSIPIRVVFAFSVVIVAASVCVAVYFAISVAAFCVTTFAVAFVCFCLVAASSSAAAAPPRVAPTVVAVAVAVSEVALSAVGERVARL